MNEVDLRKDWLTGNAVVAFVGALLTGQVWEMSEGTVKLLFIFTVPDYSGLVIFLFIAGLFFLSLSLALATIVKPLQRWAIPIAANASGVLALIVWIAFLLSLASAVPELPRDQWWSGFLIGGGLLLVLFLAYRQFDVWRSNDAEANADNNLVYSTGDIEGWSVPTLKLRGPGRALEIRVEGEIINATGKNERLDPWRRKVMSAVQTARGGKPWSSNDECAVSIGLRFHPDNHGGDSLDVDNYTKPIFDAVAGGLFSDEAPETVEVWNFPDSNFQTLLIHRLPDADGASEEGAAISVSSSQKKPSLKEKGQALPRALLNRLRSVRTMRIRE